METALQTKSDAAGDDWAITDAVVRLRQWGTDRMHALPTAPATEWIIGSTDACWLHLKDPKGRVSRRHAALRRDGDRWLIIDLGSKNGMKVDGVQRESVVLEPGAEIWIGGVTLLAESARLAALRSYLGRILGWKTRQTRAVDFALRSVRMAAARRSALVLCGEDDLVLLARSLHRRALGPDRPFIVCDPRRKQSKDTVRNSENYTEAMPAMLAATRGSLCIWNHKRPRDFREMKLALEDPDIRVHLIVCARDPSEADMFGTTAITIPRLADRPDELTLIVEEYWKDAASELGLVHPAFTAADNDWVLKHETASLPEIEKATMRLLALRQAGGSIGRAAARLDMARQSLHDWIERRSSIPVKIASGD